MATSRVACASFNLGTNTTISITRDNKAYTHTLKYSFNGATGTIATKTTQTTVVWTPPASTFYAKIPNSTSGYGTVTCETYNGNTLVGTTTAGFYAYAVKSDCLPTVTGSVEDTNPATLALTGDSSAMVLWMSKPKATVFGTPKNGATIKELSTENPVGLVANTSPFTFDTVYSDEFRFKATDSRGYSTLVKIYVPFVEYNPCHFDKIPVIERTETTSTTAKVTLTGYCFNGSFGKALNTLVLKYRYKTGGTYSSYVTITGIPTWNTNGTFSITATVNNLSLEESYTFEFVVEDKLSSFPVEVVLSQGVGDFRIAKDYVQAKNNLYLGTKSNTEFRAVKANRTLYGNHYEANFGAGNAGGGGSCAIELYENEVQVARYDLHKDGFMYNTKTYMSVAEIMSMLPSVVGDGAQGYFLLNGGDRVQPVLVQWGRVNVATPTANVVVKQPIVFTHSFSSAPFVCCDKATGTPATVFANVGDTTKDGFTIYLQRNNTASTAILWMAIGNGTASLPE
jgi:hypothetical protein